MGQLEYVQPNYQHTFWYSESLVHIFHYSTISFTKKLSHISNSYLGLGFEFEFGPQRIRDLAFVCPQSVVLPFHFILFLFFIFILLQYSQFVLRTILKQCCHSKKTKAILYVIDITSCFCTKIAKILLFLSAFKYLENAISEAIEVKPGLSITIYNYKEVAYIFIFLFH